MSNPSSEARHYAVRRVNPFEGVLQIVETRNARAYSPNGAIWQIQVLTQRPDHTWRSSSDAAPIEQYFNFGLWDAADGMQRIPANPVLDIGAMSAAADVLIDALKPLVATLPLTLTDDHECWATDHAGRPVALLATTEDPGLIPDLRVTHWCATRISEHGFVSPSLLEAATAAADQPGPRQHAEELERLVRQNTQKKTWFRRTAGGAGISLSTAGEGGMLDARQFPPLGLNTEWQQDRDRNLAWDYLAWRAPQLLMLQNIDDNLRHRLEPHACRQAVELAAGYQLIPKVIDRAAMEAARVEARLRRSAT